MTEDGASSQNLGFCGLPAGLVPNLSWAEGMSSVDATPGPFGGISGGNAQGTGSTGPVGVNTLPAAKVPKQQLQQGVGSGDVFGVPADLLEGMNMDGIFLGK